MIKTTGTNYCWCCVLYYLQGNSNLQGVEPLIIIIGKPIIMINVRKKKENNLIINQYGKRKTYINTRDTVVK